VAAIFVTLPEMYASELAILLVSGLTWNRIQGQVRKGQLHLCIRQLLYSFECKMV